MYNMTTYIKKYSKTALSWLLHVLNNLIPFLVAFLFNHFIFLLLDFFIRQLYCQQFLCIYDIASYCSVIGSTILYLILFFIVNSSKSSCQRGFLILVSIFVVTSITVLVFGVAILLAKPSGILLDGSAAAISLKGLPSLMTLLHANTGLHKRLESQGSIAKTFGLPMTRLFILKAFPLISGIPYFLDFDQNLLAEKVSAARKHTEALLLFNDFNNELDATFFDSHESKIINNAHKMDSDKYIFNTNFHRMDGNIFNQANQAKARAFATISDSLIMERSYTEATRESIKKSVSANMPSILERSGVYAYYERKKRFRILKKLFNRV